jgi:hypothetical protein
MYRIAPGAEQRHDSNAPPSIDRRCSLASSGTRLTANGLAAGLVFVSLLSCGRRDPPQADVSGRVTLNGRPLAGAKVVFEPLYGSGLTASGITDSLGRYRLEAEGGQARIRTGPYRVRIGTFWIQPNEPGVPVASPEIVPAGYNVNSVQTRTVQAGLQTLDFELSADGPAEQAYPDRAGQDGRWPPRCRFHHWPLQPRRGSDAVELDWASSVPCGDSSASQAQVARGAGRRRDLVWGCNTFRNGSGGP